MQATGNTRSLAVFNQNGTSVDLGQRFTEVQGVTPKESRRKAKPRDDALIRAAALTQTLGVRRILE
jgi:hypothetical protein